MTYKPAIALSGGLDSLTAGFLLKKRYPGLFGIHFYTGYEESRPDLSFISEQLGIDIQYIDLSAVFEKQVVDYFANAYFKGNTPNPCLICNRQIKFGHLLKAAADCGADRIATGHYAVTRTDEDGRPGLLKGKDPLKDQSYFLSMLTRSQLGKSLFPLGHLTKEAVREIAGRENLVPLHRSESQDICFVKGNAVADFLRSKTGVEPASGDILTTDGERIGKHDGLHRFTVGQRRGINCPASRPYYVKRIDVENNALVVCFKEALEEKIFYADRLNWIKGDPAFPLRAFTKIRYNHQGEYATVKEHAGGVKVIFDTAQQAIAPGQAAVFYQGNEVLGAGIIK